MYSSSYAYSTQNLPPLLHWVSSDKISAIRLLYANPSYLIQLKKMNYKLLFHFNKVSGFKRTWLNAAQDSWLFYNFSVFTLWAQVNLIKIQHSVCLVTAQRLIQKDCISCSVQRWWVYVGMCKQQSPQWLHLLSVVTCAISYLPCWSGYFCLQ